MALFIYGGIAYLTIGVLVVVVLLLTGKFSMSASSQVGCAALFWYVALFAIATVVWPLTLFVGRDAKGAEGR